MSFTFRLTARSPSAPVARRTLSCPLAGKANSTTRSRSGCRSGRRGPTTPSWLQARARSILSVSDAAASVARRDRQVDRLGVGHEGAVGRVGKGPAPGLWDRGRCCRCRPERCCPPRRGTERRPSWSPRRAGEDPSGPAWSRAPSPPRAAVERVAEAHLLPVRESVPLVDSPLPLTPGVDVGVRREG